MKFVLYYSNLSPQHLYIQDPKVTTSFSFFFLLSTPSDHDATAAFVWGLSSELRHVYSTADWTWRAPIPQVPNELMIFPPNLALPQSVSKDSKAFHRRVTFKGLPCWDAQEKWEEALSVEGDVTQEKNFIGPVNVLWNLGIFFSTKKEVLNFAILFELWKKLMLLFYNLW